jgi:20S proteasome alpha/beta subunit
MQQFPTVKPRPFFEGPKIKKRMSAVIGLKCKDAIVFAAESQLTGGGFKYLLSHKIRPIQFKSGFALFGEAGGADFSNYAMQLVEDRARLVDLDKASITKLAVDVIRDIRAQIIEQNPRCSDDFALFQRDEYNFELMFGFYHQSGPVLFSIRSSLAACPRRIDWSSGYIGCGSFMAHYLLKDVDASKLSSHEGAIVASYVISEIKESTDYCDGQTAIFMMAPTGKPEMLTAEKTVIFEGRVRDLIKLKKKSRLEAIKNLIQPGEVMPYNVGIKPGDVC